MHVLLEGGKSREIDGPPTESDEDEKDEGQQNARFEEKEELNALCSVSLVGVAHDLIKLACQSALLISIERGRKSERTLSESVV